MLPRADPARLRLSIKRLPTGVMLYSLACLDVGGALNDQELLDPNFGPGLEGFPAARTQLEAQARASPDTILYKFVASRCCARPYLRNCQATSTVVSDNSEARLSFPAPLTQGRQRNTLNISKVCL